MAVRVKIWSDEAKPGGCGSPNVKGESEVCLGFSLQPKGPHFVADASPEGRGQFS